MKTLPQKSLRRAILTGTILPVALIASANAANVFWTGLPVTLDNNPSFVEGLQEGFVNVNNDFTTPVASANPGPTLGESLTLRMGQSTAVGATAWADNRTWIYAGEIFTGPNGTISMAANNDDTDFFRIDGTIVLQNTVWNVPNAAVVRGLLPNTWVPFEYRVANGGGGAGPSGQNTEGGAGWTGAIGVVMSHDDENGSLVVGDYSGGNGLGQPAEVANGTPNLFRFDSGGGVGGDNVTLSASTVVTMSGTGNNVTETRILFSGGAATTLTLEVNSNDAEVRTLSFGLTSTAWADVSTAIFKGSANIRVGNIQDQTFTGNLIIKDGGTGDLIFDGQGSDLDGTTLRINDGRVSVRGNNFDPLASLSAPIEVNGANAKLRYGPVGSDATATTFATPINFNESGTLEHVAPRTDTLSGDITIAAGKTLNADIAGGILRSTGGVSGPAIVKTGSGSLVLNGFTTLNTVTVSAGRLALNGSTTLTNTPVIAPGGTLALGGGVGVTYSIPTPLAVPTGGTLEVFPTAAGTLQTDLMGGTLVLDSEHGLLGEFFNSAPTNTNNFNPNWGPEVLTQGSGSPTGVNTPGSGDFTSFQNTFTGLGGAGFTFLSTTNGVSNFNFPSTAGQPFGVYGVNYTDNIQARWSGKIFTPVGGVYGFSTTSDDGSALFIDGSNVVDNNRFQGMTNRAGTVFLTPGFHDIVFGMYEGGGDAGLQVFITPPNGSAQLLDNVNLFPSLDAATFTNPINVVENSTINTAYVSAVHSDITIQSTKELTTTGNQLTATSLKLLTADGIYNINTSGANNVFAASAINDGGAKITINKTGAGVFVLDNTTTPQLLNATSVINLNQGGLGVLLQTGGLSPTGNAIINFNGGGLVLSSKGGDQAYNLPSGFGGTNPVIEARKIGTGVAGPVTVALNGNLKVPTSQVLGLKTADDYTLTVGGTADLSTGIGTVSVNGGRVNTVTPTALTGLNIAFGTTGGTTGTLNIRDAAPSIASVSGGKEGVANLAIGDGTANSVLTINQTTNTEFGGNFTQEGTTVAGVLKTGTGTLTLSGTAHNYSGGLTINGGTVVTNGESLGGGVLTLNGGTLAAVSGGLLGEYWDSSTGGDTGAQGAFGGDLALFNSYFANKGAAAVVTPTTTANRQNLGFSVGGAINGAGQDGAIFTDQGFIVTDNMAVRMSGNFLAPVAGDYTFTTRSDDGSVLFVDGQKVVNNNNYQGMTNVAGVITLTAGTHTISVGFYEGTGGAGLEVRYTPPGGNDQFITNNLLTYGGLTAANNVLLQSSSTIDPSGGTASFGPLSTAAGNVLTGLSGNITFVSTGLTSVPGGTYEFNKSGTGVLNLGALTSNGGTNPVTIRKTGDGDLLLGAPTVAQLTNTTDVVAVAGGRVIAVGGTGGTNPLGQSSVQLSNGGAIAFSTIEPTVTFPNTITITGSGSVTAGNFGGGAVNDSAVTLGSALNVTLPNTLTLSSRNNYTLNTGVISGGGNVTASGGIVNTTGVVTIGALVVNGKPTLTNAYDTTLTLSGSLNATSAKVEAGGVLRQTAGYTTTNDTTVEANGEFQVNGGSVDTNVVLKGGVLRAQTGVTNLGNRPIVADAVTPLPGHLRGILALTQGGLNPTTDGGMLTLQVRKPDHTADLTGELNIPQGLTADAAFGSLFSSTEVTAGQTFTAMFFGKFTAQTGGVHQFQSGGVDDNGAFWVDLNNNGLFETAGSAGNELVSSVTPCCGDGPVGEVTLVGGRSYNIAFGVEDTGGQSGYVARFRGPNPADPVILVNPGVQSDLWSSVDPLTGGAVVVESGAEIAAGRVSGASIVALNGVGAKLTLNNPSATADAVQSLTALLGPVAGAAIIELGVNNTLSVDSLSVANDATLIKRGAGILNATTQSLGARIFDPLAPALQIEAGVVNLNGAATAFDEAAQGTANSGNVLVSGGTLNVNGAISGAVTVNAGGRLGGIGTVGETIINGTPGLAGIIAPGNSIGTLTTGPLSLTSDAQIEFELSGGGNDLIVVNGNLTLDGFLQVINLGGITDGTYRIIDFTGSLNDQGLILDPAFLAVFPGSSIDTAVPNQVNLVVIPEPTAFAALFGGLGVLAGLRRFRRS